MHIPDNYLSPLTCGVMTLGMIPIWKISLNNIQKELPPEKLPTLGIGAAASFLFMMFNIPLPGGTTGHAIGGVLLALLLGPYGACISISVALLLQALMFGDGGILSFGANCFNMAFVMPFVGYYMVKLITSIKHSETFEKIGVVLGGFMGLNAAALLTAMELGIQPYFYTNSSQAIYCPYPLEITIPAIMIPHLLIVGWIEGGFTFLVYSFLKRARNKVFYESKEKGIPKIGMGLILLLMLTPLGLLANGEAWGEWSRDEIAKIKVNGKILGYVPKGIHDGFGFAGVFPDYSIQGISQVFGYWILGIAGVAILIILFKVLSMIKKEKVDWDDPKEVE